MNIVTEPHIAGKPITDKPRARPVRMVRWFIIVAVLMSAVIGAAVYFDYWRAGHIKTHSLPKRAAADSGQHCDRQSRR